MDKIDRKAPSAPTGPAGRELLSRQVSDARYFFLNLAPKRGGRVAAVMGGRERCNPDYRVARSRFPYFLLEFVVDGRGTVELDGQRHALAPGVIFASGPGTRVEMQTDPDRPMTKYFVGLAGAGVMAQLARCGVPPGQVRALEVAAEVTSVMEDLVREAQRSGPLVQPISETLLALLFLKIQETAAQLPRAGEPARAAFVRCKALIDAQAERLGTLEEIAAVAAVETSSVCRWFRRYQGTSPYQYLLRRKMTLAAEHLIENGGLVKEAAQRVGFADPYHFSRCFKAVHGVPPSRLTALRR